METNKLMRKKNYTIGIDLGGTKILTALIDNNWKIKGLVKKKTKATIGHQGVIKRIIKTIDEILKENALTNKDILAIGIGAPGMVDENSGNVIYAPNLTGWKDIPLGITLSKSLKTPVTVGNDVNMGLYGEFCFGAAKGYKDIIGIFIGTGIGGAIINNGKVISGANHMAGEIGHMVINKEEKSLQCGCGKYGCIEATAGRLGIAKQIAVKIEKGSASVVCDITQDNAVKLKSGKLKKALESKDTLVIKMIKIASEEIGIGIANLINILDPELVVVGGGVIEALSDFMLPLIRRSTEKNTINFEARQTQIVESLLGDDAAILGAASYALNKV